MRRKTSHQNRFMRIITIPIRVLSKARDFYVKSITDCSNSAVGFQGGPGALPKSFSVASSRSNESEDYRELIRAASTRTMSTNRVDYVNSFMQQQQQQMMRMRQSTEMMESRGGSVPRSCSVGMASIDEEAPSVFFGEEDGNVNVVNKTRDEIVYPRSRSYAVSKRSIVF